MKQKVVNVSYRKDSQTFPEWLKYEVELLNEDGSVDKIPAYGKDLQDALSRVVHDQKVDKIEQRTKRIPDLVWVILWFGYMLGWTLLTREISGDHKFDGLFFISGIALITGVTLWAKAWFRKRNRDKDVNS